MSLEEYIYSEIKKAIFNGEIPLETQLNEKLLSKAFDVSRTPIRSVLKRMQYEKIVYNIPNKGTFIYQPTKKEIEDVFQLRVVLEKEAVKIACLEATKGQIDELELLVTKGEKSFQQGDYNRGIELTSNFHQSLLNITSNEYMIRFNRELINVTNIYLAFHKTAQKEYPIIPKERLDILNAVREKNVQAAVKAVEIHFESIKKYFNYKGKNKKVKFTDIFQPYKDNNK